MSQDELHRGKLRKIDLKNKSIEDFFKEKCIENGIVELDKWTKDWYSMYRGNVDNLEYFSNRKSVYQLYNHKKYEDFDIQELSKLENGDYEFIVNFYNGVTWLGEIIEEFINELERTMFIKNNNMQICIIACENSKLGLPCQCTK